MKKILPVLCIVLCTLLCKGQTSTLNISANPNPFDQTTVITFTILAPDTVSMNVGNQLGQVVLTPRINDPLPAGVYQNTIDLTGSPVGIYFVSVVLKHSTTHMVIKIVKQGTVGIPSVKGLSGLRYFPNPVKDLLHLEFIDPETSLILYNTLGQEVYTTYSSASKQELDLSALPAGSYFLKMRDVNGSKTVKILKE